ncbi:hypothetical protein UB31_35725 [Bradyrhizobium sp. LTSP849]|uniref:hypothetical protein n=1 Tax=Bradyrhizobium sp. LTSP849 TaxID=1615890 RepID=UPI0005D269E6|nr:hypothetical protein [Bradyrhizobium sp. LTSP849]KJC36731.1 hypothetical protein UB31_35725 [Bradyrhizobium sp. LTSP849]
MHKDYTYVHRLYLVALVLLTYGGLIMSAGVISGDMHRVIDIYDYVIRATVIALVGTSIFKLLKED